MPPASWSGAARPKGARIGQFASLVISCAVSAPSPTPPPSPSVKPSLRTSPLMVRPLGGAGMPPTNTAGELKWAARPKRVRIASHSFPALFRPLGAFPDSF